LTAVQTSENHSNSIIKEKMIINEKIQNKYIKDWKKLRIFKVLKIYKKTIITSRNKKVEYINFLYYGNSNAILGEYHRNISNSFALIKLCYQNE
jgi:hypothetical protein